MYPCICMGLQASYIWKLKRNIYCCYTLVEPRQRHIIHTFLTFSLIFNSFYIIHLSTYHYIFSNFFLFISPLSSTLISLFLYPFIFFYFLLSYFPPLTINLQFSFPFYLLFFHTQNVISLSLSLSLSHFWWIFLILFLAYLLYVDEFLYYLKLFFKLMWLSFLFLNCYLFYSLWFHRCYHISL